MKLNYLLIGVIVGLIILMMVLCSGSTKSGFGEETSIAPKISDDTVLIVYAPWCGYCKQAKAEFEDAVARGNGKIIMLDATDTSNKETLEGVKVNGFPTIVKGDGTKFSGSRTADSIIKFANEN